MERDIEKQFGISTMFLPATNGETLFDAIEAVKKAGFRGFELVAADYQGVVGYLPSTTKNVGLWPRTFKKRERIELRKQLEDFEFITVHAPHIGVNIASINPGWREESVRQYIESIELAADIGAKSVTFHLGGQTSGFHSSEEEIERHNVEFARQAVDLAQRYDLLMGYEVGGFDTLKRVTVAIGSERFGVNLDMGHAVMGGTAPEQWIDYFQNKIIEVHVNSVRQRWNGYTEHEPMDRNNVINYRETFKKLKEIDYPHPFILELSGNSIPMSLEICQRAKEQVMRIWEEV